MDNEKYKQWMIKISNAKIQKPGEIAKIRSLSSKIQQFSIQINQLIKKSQQTMITSEDYINNKTSELLNIQTKNKDNCYKIQKQVQKHKQNNLLMHKNKIRSIQQLQNILSKKSKTLQSQFQIKNKTYQQVLQSQLQSIRNLKIKVVQQKQIKKQRFQTWMKNSLKKADKILASQQKDLQMIDSYQKELLERCQNVSQEYQARLQQINEQSQRKQKILFAKLEVLISDIDVM